MLYNIVHIVNNIIAHLNFDEWIDRILNVLTIINKNISENILWCWLEYLSELLWKSRNF